MEAMPNNSTSIEIVLSNQELENSRVVLVKTGDSSPSVPTSPGRGQPNNFPHVNPYLKPPKLIDQGLGCRWWRWKCSVWRSMPTSKQGTSTHHHDFTKKSKKKKRRNQHLNRLVKILNLSGIKLKRWNWLWFRTRLWTRWKNNSRSQNR